jgi:pimeloyl-ACP methyl ester carboxylesterase
MRALRLRAVDCFLRYHDLPGADPPLVFLHALGYSSASLVETAAHPLLAGKRRLIPDLLGFGLSDKPESFEYSIEAHAQTVIELLEAVRVERCMAVGHSLGGSVAIALAAMHPGLVASLVVAEANLDPGIGPVSGAILEGGEQTYVWERFAAALERAREEALGDPRSAALLGMQAVASPAAMYRTARSLTADRRPTFREQLLDLDMPRTFIVGAQTLDVGVPPLSGEDGGGLEGAGVRRLVVPDAGHPMMFDNPHGFAAAVADGLARPV